MLALVALQLANGSTAAVAAGKMPGLPDIWMSARQTVDFMTPYLQSETWAGVVKSVDVIKLPSVFVGRMSDKQLKAIFQFVDQHNIKFGIEAPLLTPGRNGCGDRVEGFTSEGTIQRLAERIKSLGGTLSVIGMDEPLFFGHFATRFWLPSGGVCQAPIDELARNAARVVAQVRAIFPDVKIGDIEPVVGVAGMSAAQQMGGFGAWMDAFRQATGQPLAFMHFDVAWGTAAPVEPGVRPIWADQLAAAFTTVRQRGIRTGVIYDGSPMDIDNVSWEQHAMQRFDITEKDLGLVPDDAVFETWMPHPDRLVPENQPGTLTHVIANYLAWKAGKLVIR